MARRMPRHYYRRSEWPAGLRLFIGDQWARWLLTYRIGTGRYRMRYIAR